MQQVIQCRGKPVDKQEACQSHHHFPRQTFQKLQYNKQRCLGERGEREPLVKKKFAVCLRQANIRQKEKKI